MKLEDQVCSLQLAKRLKELGVAQMGAFSWCWEGGYFLGFRQISALHEDKPFGVFAAFTVAELGEMLPSYPGEFPWKDAEGKWWVTLETPDQYSTNTEANARAEQLIYLIESNLIDPKNTRRE